MAWNPQQFGQAPNVVGQSGFHRRGYAQAAMNAAEIVMREVKGNSSLQVFQFARERQRQARESRNLHPHCEVLAFDKASRNVARVRIPASDFGYNLRDSW